MMKFILVAITILITTLLVAAIIVGAIGVILDDIKNIKNDSELAKYTIGNLQRENKILKEKAQKYYDKYNNYRHQISKEAQNKNKEQIVRERDILQDRINKTLNEIDEYIRLCAEPDLNYLSDILGGKDNENN